MLVIRGSDGTVLIESRSLKIMVLIEARCGEKFYVLHSYEAPANLLQAEKWSRLLDLTAS